MIYKNGEIILPSDLLNEIQKYVQGELIYIPKKCSERSGWGKMNGTRTIIENRNNEIFSLYKSGLTVDRIAERYHLSEDSIRKIIFKLKNNY